MFRFVIHLVEVEKGLVVNSEEIKINANGSTYEEAKASVLDLGQHILRVRHGNWFMKLFTYK